MTPLDWLLLSLVAGLSLALWRVIVLRAEDRAERLRLKNRIADDAVEMLRLRSLVRAVDGSNGKPRMGKTTEPRFYGTPVKDGVSLLDDEPQGCVHAGVMTFGVDVQKDGVKIVGYNAAGEPVYEWPVSQNGA